MLQAIIPNCGNDINNPGEHGLTAYALAEQLQHEGVKAILSRERSSQGTQSCPRHRVCPTRVTVSCPEKGEVHGKVVLLPRSFQELLEIGAEKFSVSPAKVFFKNGGEVEDIDVIADCDHLVFVSVDLESNCRDTQSLTSIPERQSDIRHHGRSLSAPSLSRGIRHRVQGRSRSAPSLSHGSLLPGTQS